jgi:hypothetical protein
LVEGQADLAHLGHVNQARLSQITNLLVLFLDIQDSMLGSPKVLKGRESVIERQLMRKKTVSHSELTRGERVKFHTN